jgi:hypothetical protein
MSNSRRVPRDEFARGLTHQELLDRYIALDPAKKAKKGASSRTRAPRAAQTGFSQIKGRGEYTKALPKTQSVRNPYQKIDPRTDYSFEPNYGARLGSVVGEGIQSFAHALGFGEYNIKQNSLLSSIVDMGTSPPMVRNTKRGEATVISHREYLGELKASSVGTPSQFEIQSYSINPGNSNLFPFLAAVSQNFQEWEARGILIELKSESTEYASSGSLGSMFCAVDYNSAEAPPNTKQQLENMEYACSSKPSKSILMPIECAPFNDVLTHLYIVPDNAYPPNTDKRFSDIGTLHVGSQGIPVPGQTLAEIWITYEIALFKPRLPLSLNILKTDVYIIQSYDNTHPFGVATRFGPPGYWEPYVNNTELFTLPPLNTPSAWKFVAHWQGVGATCTSPFVSAFGNLTFLPILTGETTNYSHSPQDGLPLIESVTVQSTFYVTDPSLPSFISWSSSSGLPTLGNGDFSIMPIKL